MKEINKSNSTSKICTLISHIPEFTHKTTVEEIQQRIKGKDHEFIMVKDNGHPAGFLVAYALDEETYYNWIMGVLPAFRKKGYGRQLIKQFESIAKQKGYPAVQVKTMDKFPAMRRLLAKMEYQEIGHDAEGKIILRKNL